MYIYIHVYTYAHMYEILENQLATQFTMYNHCGAETWEFSRWHNPAQLWQILKSHRKLTEILKSHKIPIWDACICY